MIKPSFLVLALSGLLIVWALYLVISNHNSEELQGINMVKIILFFSIALSLHGMMHMWAEIYHHYNPLQTGKFYY